MRRIRRALAAWVVVAVLLLLGTVAAVWKALNLSADPVADKRCPPLVPVSIDPAGPRRTEIVAPAGLVWAQR
ncbi:MAG: hypothetical protein ACRELS_14520, partial [Candidatus Rokuibacteriota bacterium]